MEALDERVELLLGSHQKTQRTTRVHVADLHRRCFATVERLPLSVVVLLLLAQGLVLLDGVRVEIEEAISADESHKVYRVFWATSDCSKKILEGEQTPQTVLVFLNGPTVYEEDQASRYLVDVLGTESHAYEYHHASGPSFAKFFHFLASYTVVHGDVHSQITKQSVLGLRGAVPEEITYICAYTPGC